MRKHLIIATVSIVVLSAILVLLLLNYNLIPRTSSVESGYINHLMKILALIAMVIFSLVVVLIGYALIFFRKRRGEGGDGLPIKGNAPLELVWTIIPLVIVISLSAYAAVVLRDIQKPEPSGSEVEVNVTAFRFGWQFEYPTYNIRTSELVLPVNQRVLFRMQSLDVIHAFWVPEFGPKQDIVPGMITELRLTPDVEGRYMLECAELCGSGHSAMTAPVRITTQEDFKTWAESQPERPPVPAPSVTPAVVPAPHVPVH